MSKPIRVSLVEDNKKLREQLENLIGTAPGFICAGGFPDAESALAGLPALAQVSSAPTATQRATTTPTGHSPTRAANCAALRRTRLK